MPRRQSLLSLLMAAALLAAVSLQPVSIALSSMLGQQHLHRAPPSAQVWLGLVGNWHGGPQVGRDGFLAEVRHLEAHALGLRHHHDIDDSSVVSLEPTAGSDGSLAGGNEIPGPLVFVAAHEVALPPAAEMAEAAWAELALLAPVNPYPRRIERPPSLAA